MDFRVVAILHVARAMVANRVNTRPCPAMDVTTTPMRYDVVLLAEDDDVLRRSLSDFLASEGFMVREASDVATLREELTGECPLAVVADVHLADGDVSEVVAELARREDSERPNVVLMSASTGAAKLAGEHRVQLLAKPFDLDALVQALLVPLDERPSDAG
jgi:DNA-binding response OmpR family regulator